MPQSAEADLIDLIGGFTHDPLGFVLAAFPWGEPGPLLNESGPRAWQADVLNAIGESLANGATIGEALQAAVQVAVASGHGVGKSALVAWLILWAMSTCPKTRGVVTANTDGQLKTKTWPEVTKWHGMAINRHWFNCAATSLHAIGDEEKTWRVDAIPWSENNTEAFAGLHNKGSRILVIFDEASAIADKIWEVTEGALTDEDTEIVWAAFGNPTRNTGRFRECFGRLKHRWHHKQIDSRTVDGTNKDQLDKWINDYGEDSDFARVRIKGQFPRAGSNQFISSDVVSNAKSVDAHCIPSDPLILGCDPARFGDDETVIWLRQGRDARSIPCTSLRGSDTMATAAHIVAIVQRLKVDHVFIDETGVGGGVVDRCRQLGITVTGVNNGSASDYPVDGELVHNKAAEMWARGRAWLKAGGAIPDDSDLMQQLEGREYGFNEKNCIVLERKADMKKRGLSSPDRADALFLTLAYPVMPRKLGLLGQPNPQSHAASEYDPHAGM